jgi:hypothetical protein
MLEQDEVLLWVCTPDDEHAIRAIAVEELDSDLILMIDQYKGAHDRRLACGSRLPLCLHMPRKTFASNVALCRNFAGRRSTQATGRVFQSG